MSDDIVFYYFYWEHKKENNKRFFWHTLLLSIICVKNVYPSSKIKIVCYSEPCQDLIKLRRNTDVEIIYLSACYIIKNKLDRVPCFGNGDSKYLLSKPIDCYNLAISHGDLNIALIDIDFFIFEEFVNIDFSKFGVFYDLEPKPPHRVNTGVLLFNTKSESNRLFFSLYESFLRVFDHHNEDIENAIKVPIYNSVQSLQEEIIISLIIRKFWELDKKVFYNISDKNHKLYDPCQSTVKYSRNIHTSLLKKWRICSVLLNCSSIQKIVKSCRYSFAVPELMNYFFEKIKDQQELNLIQCLNNSNLKITSDSFACKITSKKTFL